MELRHLRYFLAVAETLNFSRAAVQLNMAQPPLSQQIRALEKELGVKLFNRQQRPLQLTPAGQAFLPEAHGVLTQVERASRIAQQANRGEVGQLVIGFNSAAMQTVLPAILKAFSRQFPLVKLQLCELDSQLQLEQLANGQIDCGFLHSQQREMFHYHVLCKEPLVVALPDSHRLVGQSVLSLEALLDETFILPPPKLGQSFYYQVLKLCEGHGFIPKVIQEARFLQTVLGLVVAGMGIALVPASIKNLQRRGVVYRELQPTFEIETLLAWPSTPPGPVLSHFLKTAIG
ncbi:family transcriptional regulator [Leptolyngbya sp. Heron Island J]|uniref:LysR family transcriptional regulator n=1 Tax=Leptolyngbya sp. Heron Island J TaxID=1385935 RepID=UPI0003B975E6|nr:LysR family transcriptional regulator [Leptolyngbya sp. Heron Island J]ESA35990.1 family transcriptional regulator [Leptolyngbya sp. Heron Island J]